MNTADRRRLLGPLEAKIPQTAGRDASSNSTDMSVDSKDDKMFLKRGFVTNANGAAYIEQNTSIVEASVFGPRPIRGAFVDQASFSVEVKFIPHIKQPQQEIFNSSSNEFNPNGRTGLTNIEQKISSYIETALLPSIILTKYPKSTIDLQVTVLDTQIASLLELIHIIVNCSSLALVDAGIELKDIVTSGHIGGPADTFECLTSFMILKNDEIVGIWLEGEVDENQLEDVIQKCNKTSRKIRSAINAFLVDDI